MPCLFSNLGFIKPFSVLHFSRGRHKCWSVHNHISQYINLVAYVGAEQDVRYVSTISILLTLKVPCLCLCV